MGHYNNAASDPGYWIGALVVGAAFVAIAFPVALLIAVIWLGIKFWKVFNTKEVVPETVPEPEVEKPANTGKKFRKHVDIGPAAVDVWFHPESGVAKRVLRVRDEALAAQLGGKKLKLPELEYISPDDVEDIVERTISEVQAKLGTTTIAPAVAPVTAPATPAKAAKRKGAAAKTTHVGEALRFGMEEKDGKDGPYRTFCLYIFDRDAGAEHEVGRGVDLERAIKEAGVNPGDMVKVASLGRTAVTLGNGTAGYKNLWSVEKVK